MAVRKPIYLNTTGTPTPTFDSVPVADELEINVGNVPGQASDPASPPVGTGKFYYSNTLNSFRFNQNGSWINLISGGWTDDGSTVRLTTITDQVGIGTVTPATKVHVQDSSETRLRVESTQNTALGHAVLEARRTNTGAQASLALMTGSTYEWDVAVTDASGDLFFRSTPASPNNRVIIQKTTGNIGVGAVPATFKLEVAGDIGPEADNTRSLGSAARRYNSVHVGPSSLVVHNDITDTLKMSLGFSGSNATISTDGATPLHVLPGTSLTVTSTAATHSTTSGALSLTSATAATWGTTVGDLSLKSAGTIRATITTGGISLGGAFRVTDALDPSGPQDYATKNYVDSFVSAGGWTDSGTVVSLTTATDQVAIGRSSPEAGSLLELFKASGTVYERWNFNDTAKLDVGTASGTSFIRTATSTPLNFGINSVDLITLNATEFFPVTPGTIAIGTASTRFAEGNFSNTLRIGGSPDFLVATPADLTITVTSAGSPPSSQVKSRVTTSLSAFEASHDQGTGNTVLTALRSSNDTGVVTSSLVVKGGTGAPHLFIQIGSGDVTSERRWRFNGTSYAFEPVVDDTVNIGSDSLRVQEGFYKRSVGVKTSLSSTNGFGLKIEDTDAAGSILALRDGTATASKFLAEISAKSRGTGIDGLSVISELGEDTIAQGSFIFDGRGAGGGGGAVTTAFLARYRNNAVDKALLDKSGRWSLGDNLTTTVNSWVSITDNDIAQGLTPGVPYFAEFNGGTTSPGFLRIWGDPDSTANDRFAPYLWARSGGNVGPYLGLKIQAELPRDNSADFGIVLDVRNSSGAALTNPPLWTFRHAGTAKFQISATNVFGALSDGNINVPNNGSARFQIEGVSVTSTVTADRLSKRTALSATGQTLNDTITTIASYTPPVSSVIIVESHFSFRENASGSGIGGAIRRAVFFVNGGGTVSQQGTTEATYTEFDATATAWPAAVTIDTDGTVIRARVTGESATTVDWQVESRVTVADS